MPAILIRSSLAGKHGMGTKGEQTTEIYVILEGEGHLELDGERVPVKPMTAVMIKPGCRHRGMGRMKLY